MPNLLEQGKEEGSFQTSSHLGSDLEYRLRVLVRRRLAVSRVALAHGVGAFPTLPSVLCVLMCFMLLKEQLYYRNTKTDWIVSFLNLVKWWLWTLVAYLAMCAFWQGGMLSSLTDIITFLGGKDGLCLHKQACMST